MNALYPLRLRPVERTPRLTVPAGWDSELDLTGWFDAPDDWDGIMTGLFRDREIEACIGNDPGRVRWVTECDLIGLSIEDDHGGAPIFIDRATALEVLGTASVELAEERQSELRTEAM